MLEMLEVADALPETSDVANWENLYTDHRYPETLADLLNILDRVKANVAEAGYDPTDVPVVLWHDGAGSVALTFRLERCADRNCLSFNVDAKF